MFYLRIHQMLNSNEAIPTATAGAAAEANTFHQQLFILINMRMASYFYYFIWDAGDGDEVSFHLLSVCVYLYQYECYCHRWMSCHHCGDLFVIRKAS